MKLRALTRLLRGAGLILFSFHLSVSAAPAKVSTPHAIGPGGQPSFGIGFTGTTRNVPSTQYATIQSAIDACSDGDTVLVAGGIYTGDGNRDIDFKGKNITVASQNGPSKTIIDCGGTASADGSGDHGGFDIQSGEMQATISGFTVKNSYNESGIYINGSNASIENCIVIDCVDGGIYNETDNGIGGTITLTDCMISRNVGGGFLNYHEGGGTTTLTNCTISGNTDDFDGNGGGVSNENYGGGPTTLTNCTISGNIAPYVGSSYNGLGGGVYNVSNGGGTTTLTNCVITGNSAEEGGGVFNSNEYGGGATTLTNCTISGNKTIADGIIGGILNETGSSLTLINDIVYGDTGGEATPNFSASFSDIQGGYSGTGNINKDPLFVNASTGDLHLKLGSPCLGAGTPTGAPSTDLDGNTRPNRPSIGAYELPPAATLKVTDSNGNPVTGIVCDNLFGMQPELRDFLIIKFPAAYSTQRITGYVDGNIGQVVTGTGQVTYYPPDEYNAVQQPRDPIDHPEDFTKEAIRTVTLKIQPDGSQPPFVQQIYIARPPVVLVHGINSDWSAWQPFEANIASLGLRIPLTTVNHWDLTYKGNDPVETGAYRLANTITNTLYYVRTGEPIPFFDALLNSDFFNDYQNHPLAIKRVDVVGWSYGGMITRWYITPEDSGKSQSINWYQTLDNASTAPAPAYGHNIRKVFTLGSMWRGVPLSNYVNEIRFSTSNPIKLGKAPLNNLAPLLKLYLAALGLSVNIPQTINDLVGLVNSQLPTNVPSMEVMAVNSPWLSEMIYHDPFRTQFGPSIPTPFDDNIAYGSVAGDNNAYLAGLFDSYTLLDDATTQFIGSPKSPFPFLRLEYRQGAQRNYSDGVVPLWSSAIPGSYKIAPSNHTGYPNDRDTVRYVAQWLNNSALPLGATLNNLWDTNTQVASFDGNKTWQFLPGLMAPQAEDVLYPQINGIGRINPTTLQGSNTVKTVLGFERVGATALTQTNFSFQLRVSNTGTPAMNFKITSISFGIIGLTQIPPGYLPISLGRVVDLLGPPQTLTITALRGAATQNLFCSIKYQYQDANGNLFTGSSALLRLY